MGTSQTKANNKYKSKAYDRIEINVPKGKKEVLQSYVQGRGESLNGFVNRAIDEAIERDTNATPDTQPASQPQPVAEQPQQPPEQPTQQRQSFEEYLKTLPESVVQTRSREDLYMQYRDSLGLS